MDGAPVQKPLLAREPCFVIQRDVRNMGLAYKLIIVHFHVELPKCQMY